MELAKVSDDALPFAVILSEAKNLRGGGVRDKRRLVPFGRAELFRYLKPCW